MQVLFGPREPVRLLRSFSIEGSILQVINGRGLSEECGSNLRQLTYDCAITVYI